MVKALADRLAEAFAEYLHAQARRDWGYGESEQLSTRTWSPRSIAASGRRSAIRRARTTPRSSSCSTLLDAGRQGIDADRERRDAAGRAASAACISRIPQAKYFNVGRIGRDQLESYAERKGESIEEAERWLAPNLAYDPAELGVKC